MNGGVAAFKSGNSQAAIDSFTRALQLDPDFVEAELYLASAYASMVKPDQPAAQNQEIGRKAIESFEHVLQKQPDNADAIAGLAGVYASTGNPGKSRELYLRLTKSSPQNSTAFYSVAATDWLLASNKTNPLPEADKVRLIDEGLQHVDIALSLNPQYVDAMTYKNLLLRLKADTTQDVSERARLIGEADSWFSKALEARRQTPRVETGMPQRRHHRRHRRLPHHKRFRLALRASAETSLRGTSSTRSDRFIPRRHARHVFREWSYCRLRSIRRARSLDLRSFRGTLSWSMLRSKLCTGGVTNRFCSMGNPSTSSQQSPLTSRSNRK